MNVLPMRIRKNLFSFLEVWQEESHPVTLWIDAICINQEDILERNRQVALMYKIYRTATSV
jgi:hypothetical protein